MVRHEANKITHIGSEFHDQNQTNPQKISNDTLEFSCARALIVLVSFTSHFIGLLSFMECGACSIYVHNHTPKKTGQDQIAV